jgi:hypothetical protein
VKYHKLLFTNLKKIKIYRAVQIGCLILIILSLGIACKKKVVIEGTVVNNSQEKVWEGVNISRYISTNLIYRNNSITSINKDGYMLQAGDEQPGFKNNHLDNEIITGNQLIWKGKDPTSLTHGIFTGYNLNVIIKYNRLINVPMGIIRKSNGMTNTSGAIAYNVVVDPKVAVVVKGMNGVNIFNNTFYTTKTPLQTWRGLIDIYTNSDQGLKAFSRGIKVFNNIFYTKHGVLNIYIYDSACLSGFESDYNIFWCEDGEPLFKIGNTIKTFKEWRALGYDNHSILRNPNFINSKTLVPGQRLDFGTNLGSQWQTGLSVNTKWGNDNPDTTNQNGKWQVGAYVYKDLQQ